MFKYLLIYLIMYLPGNNRLLQYKKMFFLPLYENKYCIRNNYMPTAILMHNVMNTIC